MTGECFRVVCECGFSTPKFLLTAMLSETARSPQLVSSEPGFFTAPNNWVIPVWQSWYNTTAQLRVRKGKRSCGVFVSSLVVPLFHQILMTFSGEYHHQHCGGLPSSCCVDFWNGVEVLGCTCDVTAYICPEHTRYRKYRHNIRSGTFLGSDLDLTFWPGFGTCMKLLVVWTSKNLCANSSQKKQKMFWLQHAGKVCQISVYDAGNLAFFLLCQSSKYLGINSVCVASTPPQYQLIWHIKPPNMLTFYIPNKLFHLRRFRWTELLT